MNNEIMLIGMLMGMFTVFVFGVVAIVAIVHKESHVAEKALDSVNTFWKGFLSKLPRKTPQ